MRYTSVRGFSICCSGSGFFPISWSSSWVDIVLIPNSDLSSTDISVQRQRRIHNPRSRNRLRPVLASIVLFRSRGTLSCLEVLVNFVLLIFQPFLPRNFIVSVMCLYYYTKHDLVF
jgi:hypothetical protein